MREGAEKEEEARKFFEGLLGVSVTEVGLMIHPVHSWLAASPDGIVGEDGRALLEIKCPHTRDKALKDMEAMPEHHMAQIQGQLEIANLPKAYYFVYFGPDCHGVRVVKRDRTMWGQMLGELERFWDAIRIPAWDPQQQSS